MGGSRGGRRLVKASVSEVIDEVFGQAYAPKEILDENRVIHSRLGLDDSEEHAVELGDLVLTFRPDAVRNGVVYELKVQRLKSDRERLLLHGWCQLQLELHALGVEKGRLLVYRYADSSLEELEVEYSWEAANMLLEAYRQVHGLRRRVQEELRRLLAQLSGPQASA